MSMWEPFTERARRSIVLAQEEAQLVRDSYIAPHHLFLGMLRAEMSPVAEVLKRYGVTADVARPKASDSAGGPVPQEMIFTSRAKRVIEHAFEAARERSHHYIGTEHLFSGLLRTEDQTVASILRAANVPMDTIAAEVFAAASANPEPAMAPPRLADDPALVDHAIATQVKLLGELLRKRSEVEKLDEPLRPLLTELHREIRRIAKREGWELD
ncbi:MAG: hypothetical protein JO165_05540 [Candidatus Eremiobacteraeota bacterium]|nr:hypothetical protein [Candidatus Eremiobacteraeota bacterium]